MQLLATVSSVCRCRRSLSVRMKGLGMWRADESSCLTLLLDSTPIRVATASLRRSPVWLLHCLVLYPELLFRLRIRSRSSIAQASGSRRCRRPQHVQMKGLGRRLPQRLARPCSWTALLVVRRKHCRRGLQFGFIFNFVRLPGLLFPARSWPPSFSCTDAETSCCAPRGG